MAIFPINTLETSNKLSQIIFKYTIFFSKYKKEPYHNRKPKLYNNYLHKNFVSINIRSDSKNICTNRLGYIFESDHTIYHCLIKCANRPI